PSLHILLPTSIIPPHPSSPLFPYTTLFRSIGALEGVRLQELNDRLVRAPDAPQVVRPHVGGVGDGGREARVGLAVLERLVGTAEDRKSTRLNSSHDQISYAVFCLKKKKNIR